MTKILFDDTDGLCLVAQSRNTIYALIEKVWVFIYLFFSLLFNKINLPQQNCIPIINNNNFNLDTACWYRKINLLQWKNDIQGQGQLIIFDQKKFG